MNSNPSQPDSNLPTAADFKALMGKLLNLSDSFAHKGMSYQVFRDHVSVIEEESKTLQVAIRLLRTMERCGCESEKQRRKAKTRPTSPLIN
jgi:hypothetical protein